MDTAPPLMFHAFLDEWPRDYVKPNLSVNTIKIYSYIINAIKKHFKDMRLKDVTVRRLQQFVNSLQDEYSRSTVKSVVVVLRKSMLYAVSPCDYLIKSPAMSLQVPHNMPRAKPKKVFDDAYEIVKAAEGTPIHYALSILYHTGCRVGEVLALRWEDVDMDNKTIYVHATALNGRVIQDHTKTEAGSRVISFSDKLHDVFTKIRSEQDEKRQLTNRQYRFVCSDDIGQAISRRAFYYHWIKLKKQLGIEQTPHCFRHTHAIKLLEMGADIDMVSKRLGHSNVAVTSGVYSHVTDKRNKHLIKLLDDF